MTDRELLELAAEAVGHVATDGFGECHDMNRNEPWDPLVDDGDALRLAVKLSILVLPQPGTHTVIVDWYGSQDGLEEEYGDDPPAATRRAIVRATAEIGKAKP